MDYSPWGHEELDTTEQLSLQSAVHQAPLSMGFFRQEYWNELPFSPPGDLPDPMIKPTSPVSLALQADCLPLSHGENPNILIIIVINNLLIYNYNYSMNIYLYFTYINIHI